MNYTITITITITITEMSREGIELRVEIVDYADNWQAVKNAAMNTIGAESGKYPDTKWKRKILLAEHSPIRLLELTVRITDVPYFVVMHLVRHRVGIEHFVSTQRTDRTGIDRTQLPQGAPVNYTFRANAQAFIAISRKRLCGQAAKETRAVWKAVIEAVRTVELELADCCVPDCIYRGKCQELKCCGYYKNTDRFISDLIEYRTIVDRQPA